MKKMMLILVVITCGATSIFSQQLNLNGIVFEQGNGKSVGLVPFATIFYYNYNDTAKLEYSAISTMYGMYNIYNMRNGKYIVKISAPGYKTKRQEVQFKDVQRLAKNNNGTVYAQIGLQKQYSVQINPIRHNLKDLIKSNNETVGDAINRLKILVRNTGCNNDKYKVYRILAGNLEVPPSVYERLNESSLQEIAEGFGDKNLKNTYIEYYNLSKDKTFVDGVFNIIFNGKKQEPNQKYIEKYTETTDFFINE